MESNSEYGSNPDPKTLMRYNLEYGLNPDPKIRTDRLVFTIQILKLNRVKKWTLKRDTV